jgi:hypothetical protein
MMKPRSRVQTLVDIAAAPAGTKGIIIGFTGHVNPVKVQLDEPECVAYFKMEELAPAWGELSVPMPGPVVMAKLLKLSQEHRDLIRVTIFFDPPPGEPLLVKFAEDVEHLVRTALGLCGRVGCEERATESIIIYGGGGEVILCQEHAEWAEREGDGCGRQPYDAG